MFFANIVHTCNDKQIPVASLRSFVVPSCQNLFSRHPLGLLIKVCALFENVHYYFINAFTQQPTPLNIQQLMGSCIYCRQPSAFCTLLIFLVSPTPCYPGRIDRKFYAGSVQYTRFSPTIFSNRHADSKSTIRN